MPAANANDVPSYFNWNYSMPSLGPNGELTGGPDPYADKADMSKGTDIRNQDGSFTHLDAHKDRNGNYINPTTFMSDSLDGGVAYAFPDTDEYAHIGRVFRTDRNRAIGKMLLLVGGGALAAGAGGAAAGGSTGAELGGEVAGGIGGGGGAGGAFASIPSGIETMTVTAPALGGSLGSTIGSSLAGAAGVSGTATGSASSSFSNAGYSESPPANLTTEQLAGATGGGEGSSALFGDVGMEGGAGVADTASGGFWSKLGDYGKGLVTSGDGSFDIAKAIKLAGTVAPLFGDNTSSQTTTKNIPPWLDAASQGAVGLGAKIATRPYTPFTGDRVQPLDPNEEQAYNLARTQGGSFNQDLDTARGYANFAARPSTSFDVNQYMNPYIKGALDPAARELRLESQQQINNAGQQAAMNNSFGGSRGAILESEARRSGTQAVGDLYSRGYAQAFTNAQDQINVDRQRAAAASEQFRALGAQGQTQLMQQMQALMSTGGMARAVGQAGKDFDYQQFIENRDWDVTNLGPLLASLNVPAGGNIVNSADKSKLQTLAGVGMLLAGGYGSTPDKTGSAPTESPPIGMKKPNNYPSLWGMEPVGSAGDVSSFNRMGATTAFRPALSESY